MSLETTYKLGRAALAPTNGVVTLLASNTGSCRHPLALIRNLFDDPVYALTDDSLVHIDFRFRGSGFRV